jgi:uncharacterized membrane protein
MEMSRKPLPDLMKGIAVVLMVQVHIMELFARQEVFDSPLGKVSLFLGGPFAAPVFLAVMGYFLAASGRSFAGMIWRGIELILLGVLLNIGLNFHLLLKITNGIVPGDPWQFVFGADILFVAGLSILFISILKITLKKKIVPVLLLMLIFAALPLFIPESSGDKDVWTYLLSFFYLETEWSYFPVIPWFSYALLGYSFHLFKLNYSGLFEWLTFRVPIVLLVVSPILALTAMHPVRIITHLPSYYHHGIITFLWISVFILFIMMILHIMDREWGRSMAFRYLKWLGKEVTVIYVIQWLIIGNLATWLYKSQHPIWLLLWFAGILASSSVLAYLYSLLKNWNFHGKNIGARHR